jgi:hypothetical protein
MMMKKILSLIPDSALYYLRRLRFMVTQPERYRKFKYLRSGYSDDGYSLKPFDDYHCIFIHVPKCAGQSIRKTLFENLLPGHINVYTYQLIYPKRTYDSYFKFTFVRNPWDRLVSAYLFMKSGGAHNKDRDWAERHLAAYSDFDSFIQQGLHRQEMLAWPHFRPQVNFLKDQFGKLGVDFIGRVENIEKDMAFIQEKLNIHKELLFINRTQNKKPDYRSYYSPSTRDIVAEVYQEDIQTFGYQF